MHKRNYRGITIPTAPHMLIGNTFFRIIYRILDTKEKVKILRTHGLGYVIDTGCKMQNTNM